MRVLGRVAAFVGAAAMLVAIPGNARAASPKFSETTAIGTHNAYEKDKYTYWAQALDSGASLLELDVYADSVSRRWRVSHDKPLADDNNCEYADEPGELYSKNRNQDLGSCLDNMAAWNQLHPDHAPIVVKVEMKAGFNNDAGLGPDEFDTLVSQKLGSSVYKPSDLLGGTYTSLDSAAKANAWPARDALKGAFPAVLGAAGGDPRTSRYDASIRPWFVFFDGDAATYVNNAYDTSFYATNHYILIMTDAYGVSPAISSTDPTDAEVAARLALLAKDHASIITSDWSAKSASVLGSVATRS
ncbi:Ca2+-dependent phosphoinositide-specific phospholipase C [Streptomyces sp. NPDC001410]|uniref:Ca2+-dependent phosphoinositide-specific phospholipase C n=1 Tax=Streptomyces sp. NPDC001410 TaxID=3364574 RepID=UPI0036B17C93